MTEVLEQTSPERDWGAIVQHGRVHSAYYSDPAVFAAELRHIFYGYWVYVGHESEIPNPGDFQLKDIGHLPVIMSRDRKGEMHILLNRCRHRGLAVCNQTSGNTHTFRCIYHAWTYRSDGTLSGVPYPSGYGPEFKKEDFGLLRVPRVGVYRGFVFASLNPEVIDFDEYLGPAKPHIDNFCNASPLGKVEFTAGALKSRYRGNWKLNGNDGYHGAFLHRSAFQAVAWADPDRGDMSRAAELPGTYAYDLGKGHVRLALESSVGTRGVPDRGVVTDKSEAYANARSKYHGMMDEAYGPDKAPEVIRNWDPHMHVFPNLRVSGALIEVLQPRSVGVTELVTYPAMLAGVPKEINVARLRNTEWFNAMGGLGVPDDIEAHRRAQVGHEIAQDPWVLINRGLNREEIDPDTGQAFGWMSDEQTYRGFAKQWKEVMMTHAPGLDTVSTAAWASGPEAGAR